MKNNVKEKLKRRGKDLYNRYFFNPDNIIKEIIYSIDNNLPINENNCLVIFDVTYFNSEQIYELIKYYPNKLKEIKYITDDVIKNLYIEYGETIEIMNTFKSGRLNSNVRGKICSNAFGNSKDRNLERNITSEDVKLVKICPFLEVPLLYGSKTLEYNSASIDRIDSTKGYIKDNIQIISYLANCMKSNATTEQLIKFSKNVLKFNIQR